MLREKRKTTNKEVHNILPISLVGGGLNPYEHTQAMQKRNFKACFLSDSKSRST